MLGFIRTIRGAHPAGKLQNPRVNSLRGGFVFWWEFNEKSELIFFQLHREWFLPLAHAELKNGRRLTALLVAVANWRWR